MRRTALLIALLLGLGACAAPTAGPAPSPVATRQATGIPFASAEVRQEAERYLVAWRAPQVQAVAVYAYASAQGGPRDRLVGRGGSDGRLVVAGLPPAGRWFFELVPDEGAPLLVADRSLHLKSAPNLRDVGGLRTADGRWVRMGLAYRSDQLNRLTDADMAVLEQLGLGAVADLRTAAERAKEPDRIPAGAEHLIIDVMADTVIDTGDVSTLLAGFSDGRGAAFMRRSNRDLVSTASARAGYERLFRRLADDRQPDLYHCTAGKDRTGWASAVLLTILGVAREDIYADYLASNGFLAAKNRASAAALRQHGLTLPDADLQSVLTVRADYLDASFAEVERRYGSFDLYVRDGLGLDEAAVARLRARFLTG